MRKYDLYVSVIPTNGLEDISYAQDFLLQKIESRELRGFCKENNVPHTDVYRMATGERQPGYYIIRDLRYVIPPAWWFIGLNDKKPRAKKMDRDVKNTVFENSKAFEEISKGQIRDWVEEGYDFQTLYNIRKVKYGNIRYKTMLYFASKIPPEHWFIFKN